jgi:hypothetical protein
MKRLSLLILMAAAAIFTSCKKEGNSTDGREQNSKKYLSKIVDYVFQSPGKAVVLLLDYDAQKRCTKIRQQLIDTVGGVAQIKTEVTYNFFYNGNDEKPTHVSYNPAAGNTIIYYQYDAQGRLLKDSAIDSKGYTRVTAFTYVPGKIYAYGYYSTPANQPTYKDTAEFSGDNVSRHSWAHHHPNGALALHWEDKFTFDDKPNPFYQLNIGSSFLAGPRRELGAFIGLNKNNYVSNYQDDLVNWSPYDFTVQYRYKYDTDGYPVFAEFTDGFGPATIATKRYEYLP